MTNTLKTKSAIVRERLTHPVIDGDGHTVENLPVVAEYMREICGPRIAEKYLASLPGGVRGWHGLSRQERRDMRIPRSGFWNYTNKAFDRATVMLPNLFRERLDDLGIDFAIVYGSLGEGFLRNPDDELRLAGARTLNTMNAEIFRPHADRMAAAAVIPMNTPEEAIDELEFAVKKLGMKVVALESCIRRPIAAIARKAPEAASYATFLDVLAHASEYDYDPVWRKCIELKVAATAHTGGRGWGARTSPESNIYNHIGHFAAAGEAFCKALVIGGVVQRFPTLKFAFLEGGVGWASSLYNDLISHWEKRNIQAMRENLDPAKLDLTLLTELFAKYGGARFETKGNGSTPASLAPYTAERQENPDDLDEWSALKIESSRQFAEIFKNFFFGCEADDRMVATAFNPKQNRYGARMQAMFSSDIGHWDVTDITAVVEEAHELVEDGLITEKDFRDFTFTNPVKLHASMNRDFFKGTVVEDVTNAIIA